MSPGTSRTTLAIGRGDALHHAASLAAFDELRRVIDRDAFKLTFHADRSRATPMPLDERLRPYETSGGDFTNPRDDLIASERARKDGKGLGSGLEPSYVRAFANTAYGLRLTPEQAQDAFDTINRNLFGAFRDDLDLRRWTTDSSNFFDAGLEWWGAHWWTVHNRTRGIVVVMAASTTD